MLVMSIVNQKGGVGKSTITLNLARAIQLDGARVAVIDCDPQRTLIPWHNLNKKNCNGGYFPLHAYAISDLPKRLKEFSTYDVVLIDGAPRLEELAVEIIKVSDIIIMPLLPSPNDVWASISFIDLVLERKKVAPDLKAFFVLNREKANTTLISTAREATEDYKEQGIYTLETGIKDRIIYAKAMAEGVTAIDIDEKARCEIINIRNEISRALT